MTRCWKTCEAWRVQLRIAVVAFEIKFKMEAIPFELSREAATMVLEGSYHLSPQIFRQQHQQSEIAAFDLELLMKLELHGPGEP